MSRCAEITKTAGDVCFTRFGQTVRQPGMWRAEGTEDVGAEGVAVYAAAAAVAAAL